MHFYGCAMSLFALSLTCLLAVMPSLAVAEPASAVHAATSGSAQAPRKKAGDLSYQTMWRMQKRVDGLLPRQATMIRPVLRVAISGVDERERIEFLPAAWGVAIIGRSIDTVVPMRRGGYFAVPQIAPALARGEDAIVTFNLAQHKKWFDVGWQVTVPADGQLRYADLAQAFAELKQAQQEMAWWDIMVIDEKNARFDAVRACFDAPHGRILVDGAEAGQKLSEHCTLLAFDATRLGTNPSVRFDGPLDSVTLDSVAHYAD